MRKKFKLWSSKCYNSINKCNLLDLRKLRIEENFPFIKVNNL